MLHAVGLYTFHKIINNSYSTNKRTRFLDISDAFDELDSIRKYYNEIIVKTKERYDVKSCDISKVTTSWKFLH
jgi:hypothetical protein